MTKASLSSLAVEAESPSRLVLLHPATGKAIKSADGKEESYIMLLGMDSITATKHRRSVANKHLGRRNSKITAEGLEESASELLAALTKDWKLFNFDGEEIDYPCNRKNAVDLYEKPEFNWIREQVDAFVSDRANFMKS